MARGFVLRRRLRRDPEQVWDLLVDPARPRGGAALAEAGPPGIGGVYHGHRTSAGAPAREMVVTQWQPKRRYGVTCRMGRMHATFLYTLRGHRRGTDLELRLVLLPEGRWWPLHSLAALALYGGQLRQLRRFRRAVEAADP